MPSDFSIFVDADSCPILIRECIIKQSEQNNIPVIFVANRNIPIKCNMESKKTKKLFSMIICSNDEGAADNYIFNTCKQNDIVITRDLPFAEKLINKGISTINDRGLIFNKENITNMLEERNLSLQYEQLGIRPKFRKKTYSSKEKKLFEECLISLIHLKKSL